MASPARLILLTGATRGLGRALVDRFIEQGHRVIGCGRDPKLVAALQQRHPAPHRFDVVDVADDAGVRDWAAALHAKSAPPDLLINNAAVINANAPLWQVTAEEFDRVLDVNVKGTANVIRHIAPGMIARGTGVIVNLSSGWGRSTSAEVAPYCASKWAIEGLTQALAQELPKTMAAVPLNPGIINTEMLRSCFGAGADRFPDAEKWSHGAAAMILKLGPRDNGRPLSVE